MVTEVVDESLPTAKELEQLPLRAIAAYAARSGRRHSIELRGTISDELIDNILDRIDAAWQSPTPEDADLSSLFYAVADLYQALSAMLDHSVVVLISIGISRSASVTSDLVQAALDPSRIERHLRHAAKQAEKSVGVVDLLPHGNAEAITAARHDYILLKDRCGLHEQPAIGEPLDCFS